MKRQYFDDFSKFDVGQIEHATDGLLQNHSYASELSGTNWYIECVSDIDAIGGKRFDFNRTSNGSGINYIGLSGFSTADGAIELVTRVKIAVSRTINLPGFKSVSDNAKYGGSLSTTALSIYEYSDAWTTQETVGTATVSIDPTDWVWIRARLEEDKETVRYRVWQGTTEPSDWMVDGKCPVSPITGDLYPILLCYSYLDLPYSYDIFGAGLNTRAPRYAYEVEEEPTRLLPIKKPWTKKPPAGTPLDFSHPLVKNLKTFVTFNNSRTGHAFDHVENAPIINEFGSGEASIINDPKYGPCASTRGADDTAYFEHTETGMMAGAECGTIAAIYRLNAHQASGGAPIFIGNSNNSSQHRFGFKDYSGSRNFVIYTDTAGLMTTTESALNTGQWYFAVGTYKNPDLTSYLDGVVVDTSNVGGGGSIEGHSFATRFMAGTEGDSNRAFDGDLAMAAVWEHRALTQAEVESFSANPWQIFKPKTIYAPIDEPKEEVLPVTVPWTKQPPAGTEIDWNNSLARGLRLAINGVDGVNLVNSAGSHVPVLTESEGATDLITTLETESTGIYGKVSGTHATRRPVTSNVLGSIEYLDAKDSIKDAVTAVALAKCSEPLDEGITSLVGDAEGLKYSLIWSYEGQPDAQGVFLIVDIYDIKVASFGPISDEWHLYAGSWQNGEKVKGYRDGVLIDESLTSVTTTFEPAIDDFAVSLYYDSITEPDIDQTTALVLVWDRRLTHADHAQLGENPWQIFKPKTLYAPVEKKERKLISAPRVWTKQPPAGTPLDPSNKFVKGMTFCFNGADFANARDVVSKERHIDSYYIDPDTLTSVGNYPSYTSKGVAAYGEDNDPASELPTSFHGQSTDRFQTYKDTDELSVYTLALSKTPYSPPAHAAILFYAIDDITSFGSPSIQIVDVAGFGLAVSIDDFNLFQFGTSPFISTSEVHSVGFSARRIGTSTSMEIYVDGAIAGTDSTTSTPLGYHDDFVIFGPYGDDGEEIEPCGLILSVAWNRSLSQVEQAEFDANPWQIFKPKTTYALEEADKPDLMTFERPWGSG